MWKKREEISSWRTSKKMKIEYHSYGYEGRFILTITKYLIGGTYQLGSIEFNESERWPLYQKLMSIHGVQRDRIDNWMLSSLEVEEGLETEARQFVNIFLEHFSLQSSDLATQIYDSLNIPSENKKLFEKLCQLITINQFKQAKEEAINLQTKKYFCPIWELANYLSANDYLQQSYILY